MSGNTLRLLVVDDQVGVRRLISEVLMDEGYIVEQAATGREALERIKQKNYQLVLLDVKMPEMDGLETLREMRKIKPAVPVVLLTAYGESEIMKKAEQMGVQHFINKPFDLEELRFTVQRVLAGGRSRAEVVKEIGYHRA